MGNETLRTELSQLERRVKLLLSEHSALKSEIQQLKKANEDLKSQLSAQNGHLTNFQNQAKISRLVDSMLAEGKTSNELKTVIEGYIKEIDKCIAHLGEA
ncbi:hypothetical protein [Marinoscillum sp. MHG1-6]|uniref:hypothetical protein n=1 Tax=Marinoscillum sp. MHG1-6 TaxID=2959627 RepID=UPI0021583E21|nr:hypothetical protein [Marinoscillum sp. MHG1-6]